MTDLLSVAERSERMSKIRSKDTNPELRVRRIVHGMGYRYRLHGKVLPGRPDLVFVRRRKVVFVNGCFWHRHPDPACRLARLPKSRLDFWLPKLEGNAARDRLVQDELTRRGWKSFIVWECETRDHERLAGELRAFLDENGGRG